MIKEKFFNGVTVVLAILSILCVVIYKAKITASIFLVLAILVFLISKKVISDNNSIKKEDIEKLEYMKNEVKKINKVKSRSKKN